MHRSTRIALLALASGAAVSIAALALAIAASPLQSEHVVFENARVRVIDYASRPSGAVCGIGTHTHPPHLTIVLSPARDRAQIPGKAAEVTDMKLGDVYWSDGETHTDVNIGRTSSRVIVVELKTP
jgi:hypothetical protein